MSALDLLPDYVRADILNGNTGKLRDDLRAIPAAESAGWKVTFRNNHWHNAASFERGTLSVWIIRAGWQTAYLVDGRYTDHKTFRTLAEALAREEA